MRGPLVVAEGTCSSGTRILSSDPWPRLLTLAAGVAPLALLLGACSATRLPDRTDGFDFRPTIRAADEGGYVGLWHGVRAYGERGPSSDVFLALRDGGRDGLVGTVTTVSSGIRPQRASHRVASGPLNGDTLMLEESTRRGRRGYAGAAPFELARDDDGQSLIGEFVYDRRNNPMAPRCEPMVLRRVSSGNVGDVLVDGRLVSIAELGALRARVGTIRGLAGRWEGSYFCRDDGGVVDVRITVEEDGAYRGEGTVGGAPRRFRFEPQSNSGGYRLIDTGEGRSRPGTRTLYFDGRDVTMRDGQAAYLALGMGGLGARCYQMRLVRFEPIEGFGGAYAEAQGFHGTCEAIRRTWFGSVDEERRIARELKVRLPRALAGYDPERALRAAALDGPAFARAFGQPASALSPPTARALERQLQDCAMVGTETVREALRRALYPDNRLGVVSRGSRSLVTWMPTRVVEPVVRLDAVSAAGARQTRSREEVARLLDTVMDLEEADQVVARVGRARETLESLPPSELASLLEPMIARVEQLRATTLLSAGARFERLDVPYSVLPDGLRAPVRALASGTPVRFDAATMVLASGMAMVFVRDCQLPRDDTKRAELRRFVVSGVMRASLGASYSDPDIRRAVADMTASNVGFGLGARSAEQIGCRDPFAAAFVDVLADRVASSRSDGRGGDSLFVRTCALQFTLKQCECLASQGQGVMPGIYQRRYERGIIRQIIERNPLVGATLAFGCGIGNY